MARTVTDKTMHLGRAGQFAAMAEILARGWNVAIPEVDLGDDVFVAQDDGARLTRVQLKTTIAEPGPGGKWRANSITLPRRQLLRDNEPVPLTYVFAVRTEHQWQFVIVSREDLRALWDDFQAERPSTTAQGEMSSASDWSCRRTMSPPGADAAFSAFATTGIASSCSCSLRGWHPQSTIGLRVSHLHLPAQRMKTIDAKARQEHHHLRLDGAEGRLEAGPCVHRDGHATRRHDLPPQVALELLAAADGQRKRVVVKAPGGVDHDRLGLGLTGCRSHARESARPPRATQHPAETR